MIHPAGPEPSRRDAQGTLQQVLPTSRGVRQPAFDLPGRRPVVRSTVFGAASVNLPSPGFRVASDVLNRDLQPAARVGDGERDRRSIMDPPHRNDPALARFEQQCFVQPRAARIGVVKSLNDHAQTAAFRAVCCFQRSPRSRSRWKHRDVARVPRPDQPQRWFHPPGCWYCSRSALMNPMNTRKPTLFGLSPYHRLL